MFRALFSLLKRHQDPWAEALTDWRNAHAEYVSARVRGDTRRMNEAQRRTKAAAMNCLRLELGR